MKKAEVKALMHDYDRKGIGKIDAEEFKDIGKKCFNILK